MKDPHGPRPLVEDASFLDSLNELDRGMDVGRQPEEAPADPPRSSPTRPPPPAPIFAPPPASKEPAIRHRSLADLFPPSTLESERPPGPLLGTSVGPQLPDGVVPRRLADAELFPRAGPLTYETFYGLREKPFGLSTDPKFFFHSNAHERVAVELLTAIRQHDGFCLLTGELGVGKTTLCRAVAGELDRRTVSSIILEPVGDAGELLKIVLVDFGVMSRDDLRAPRAPHELLGRLASFFESLAPRQGSALVVLDEAHRQPPDVIAQLRALATDGAGAGLLQVVLVGPPSLAAALKAPALRAIDSATTVRSELGPLAADEIGGYVLHRLAVAGTSPRVDFDAAALQRIYDLSRGVPGVVNLLCDRALAGGFQRSASTIDVKLVNAAAVALDVAPAATLEREAMVRAAIATAALLVLVLVGAAGAAWVFSDALARTIVSWEAVPLAPGPPMLRVVPPLAQIPPPEPQGP